MELTTVGNLIRDLAAEHGDRTALIFPELDSSYTFRDLDELTTRVARNLYRLGFRKGDRFAVWANNRPEWIILQFATAKIGVILVTVNTGLRRSEVQYVLDQSGAAGIALVRSFKNVSFEEELNAVRDTLPSLKHVFVMPDDFKALAAPSDFELPPIPIDPNDCINMQYTSGTTGFPKGVMLSHRNILRNGYDLGARTHMSPSDIVCLKVPLFHCFGCVIAVLGAYTHGAQIVGLTAFDPLKVLEAVHNCRCTVMYGVPTMFIAELNHPDFGKFDLSSLRTGIMAGTVCPKDVMTAVVEQMGIREMIVAYGLTEASPAVTASFPEDSIEVRCGTIGCALPGVEAKIVDPATGAELPPGREGEIITRGYHVMLGYYNKPEETKRAIRDGWLWTGDLAVMDDRGYFRITGRSKDIIIRGGENIAPREIEELLLTHPAIREAYVYGVPSKFFGQEVAVAVQLKDGATLTAAELVDYCKTRVAAFKVPSYVDFVTSFPTTPSGKIQKYKLTEMWVARNS